MSWMKLAPRPDQEFRKCDTVGKKNRWTQGEGYGCGSIPINTSFTGMNIHLPAILM